MRRTADAAGPAGRQHLRQLSGSEPGVVAADDIAAGDEDRGRAAGAFAELVAGAEPGDRPGRHSGAGGRPRTAVGAAFRRVLPERRGETADAGAGPWALRPTRRSEEHTSELQSLMSTSYAVVCLKNKN